MSDNKTSSNPTLKTISDFAKRKGFVYQGSEVYGGLANTWDYGPKGLMLKTNIKNAWRSHFIKSRTDMVEIDCGIFMNNKVWEASGHVGGFSDCLIDDKDTKHRFRVDHLIEDQHDIDVEGWTPEDITKLVVDKGLINPHTKKQGNWTEARYMNLMFETNRDKIGNDPSQRIYLRPETAQGIFVNFKNIMLSERARLPFGVGQIGKAFRNEITPGNFVFRVVEFEQMEIEYFVKPPSSDEEIDSKFDELLLLQKDFLTKRIGLSAANLKEKIHLPEKLAHYSKKSTDFNYNYPFGSSELTGLAYRTDFDLKQHSKDYGTYNQSNTNMEYLDPITNEKFVPHCIEPTVGVERLILACLCESYTEENLGTDDKEDIRIVMKFNFEMAPYKVAILPLMKKDGLSELSQEVFGMIRSYGIDCDYDETGSIGKRYRRQDENGTPFCICVDYQTKEDRTVTIRHRDTMIQSRVLISELPNIITQVDFEKIN